MRIISNLGDVDIPYERSSIVADKYGCIHAYSSGIHGTRIGMYDTYEQALDVMQQIRDAYNNGCSMFKMPTRRNMSILEEKNDVEIKMETSEFDVLEKCSNCKFEHFASDEDPCRTCIPKRNNETGIRYMIDFQRKEE